MPLTPIIKGENLMIFRNLLNMHLHPLNGIEFFYPKAFHTFNFQN